MELTVWTGCLARIELLNKKEAIRRQPLNRFFASPSCDQLPGWYSSELSTKMRYSLILSPSILNVLENQQG